MGYTAGALAADAGILSKILGSGKHLCRNTTKLIVSNDEMEKIIKLDESLEDSGLLLKEVSEATQNDVKE